MTRDECGKLVTTAAAYHPNTFKDLAQLDQTVGAWFYVLQDVDFKAAMNALVVLEASGKLGYFPTVGMVRNAVVPITIGESYLSEAEAVAMWRRAIANGNYNAQEEFDRMPPEMQAAVGSPENLKWDNHTSGEWNGNVQESHFRRTYNQTVERLKAEARTPEKILRLQKRKAEESLQMAEPPVALKEKYTKLIQSFGKENNGTDDTSTGA